MCIRDRYWDTDCTRFETVTIKMVESSDVAYQLYQSGEIDEVGLTESKMCIRDRLRIEPKGSPEKPGGVRRQSAGGRSKEKRTENPAGTVWRFDDLNSAAVSYTHLDVYKRQAYFIRDCR